MLNVVRYRVCMPQPHSHLFEVEAVFPAGDSPLQVCMPVWTPGSYLVREFSRNVQDLSAFGQKGEALRFTRLDKSTYQVSSSGGAIRLRYRVYANELTVRTSHLDGSHGYINGASVFLYSKAARNLEHRVSIDAPEGWSAFCALPQQGAEFLAPSYDDLVDSPFEIGPHSPLDFAVGGVPHRVIVWGDGAPDRERLTSDLQKLCEAGARLFGALPIKNYLFLVYLTDKGRGGLEHKSSTSLLFPASNLGNPKVWEDLLSLAAHEYFHLWNVKRIKPLRLVPFDYTRENYTELLWAFEGITSYYEVLLLRRSGLISASRLLNRLGEAISALQGTPGREVQTLAEASLTAWIKHYRPDENSPNSAISYYLKGKIVAALLDLEIRRSTRNQRSLDDVMRLLWVRYGDERGVPEDGVERAASEVSSRDLSGFFDSAIRSTQELDYSAFRHVGLELKFRVKESPNDRGGTPPQLKGAELRPKGWLGVILRGTSAIASVLEGSPAMKAGLYADDEIVALDGYRVDGPGLIARCEEKKPGDRAAITIFRRDKLREVQVQLGEKPADAAYLERIGQPTEEQESAYHAWLGARWDEPG
jgi:predicted metalloprotease with PDZ domain